MGPCNSIEGMVVSDVVMYLSLISALMHMVLSGTLGMSATLVKSPSASIAFLNSIDISYLGEGCYG
jgi:hypothetical protein